MVAVVVLAAVVVAVSVALVVVGGVGVAMVPVVVAVLVALAVVVVLAVALAVAVVIVVAVLAVAAVCSHYRHSGLAAEGSCCGVKSEVRRGPQDYKRLADTRLHIFNIRTVHKSRILCSEVFGSLILNFKCISMRVSFSPFFSLLFSAGTV
jgi:hypothetical protein